MVRPATLDHLRSNKKPVTKSVVIPMDSDLADRFEEAKRDREILMLRVQASSGSNPELVDKLDEVDERYNELLAAVEEDAVEFKFHSIGRPAYEQLLLDHPPTKDQKDKARKAGQQANYNADTFPPALIAACSMQPVLEPHEAEEIWKSDDWNQGELMALFMAAVDCNQSRRVVELGKD